MDSLDKSSVYTEQDLVDIINSLFQEEDTSYEDEVSAWCMLLKHKDLLQCCSSEAIISNGIKNWISNMAGYLAEKGFVAFGNALDSAEEHGRTLLAQLQAARKNKSLSEEYINERFAKFEEYQQHVKDIEEPEFTTVIAVPYDKQSARFGGLETIVDSIVSMADTHDEDSFASDNIWETLAAQSNTVCKVDPPKKGQNFKQFRWEPPFIKSIDFKKSEWNDSSAVEQIKKKIFEIKEKTFKDLIEASKHLQTLCKKMQSEVEHKRFTDEETMARNYARNYVISKLIVSIQNLILKEIGYFCTVGIKKLGKFKEQEKKEEPKENTEQKTDNKEEQSQQNNKPENKEQ